MQSVAKQKCILKKSAFCIFFHVHSATEQLHKLDFMALYQYKLLLLLFMFLWPGEEAAGSTDAGLSLHSRVASRQECCAGTQGSVTTTTGAAGLEGTGAQVRHGPFLAGQTWSIPQRTGQTWSIPQRTGQIWSIPKSTNSVVVHSSQVRHGCFALCLSVLPRLVGMFLTSLLYP